MRRCGCRTRRSTSRSTSRAAAAETGAGRLSADRASLRKPRRQAQARRSRKRIKDMVTITDGHPRPPTGPCPGTGKATCSWAREQVRDRHPGRTHHRSRCCPPARRPRRRGRPDASPRDGRAARGAAPDPDLGPGHRAGQHAQIAAATGLEIYFCDPASPWQRGTNENTNGLLRQYFPKGTDLSFRGPGFLDNVATEINNRPRKTLGWNTPAEALDKLLSDHDNQPGVANAG